MNSKPYLQEHARKIDLYLYEYIFENASAQLVIDELATYQNADGGFGKALEPDLRLPDSSALATTIAFQYLAQLDAPADKMIARAVRFLVESYDKTVDGWVNIPSKAAEYPRAPWWESYESVKQWAEWGNPSAEILGWLLKYDHDVDAELVQKLLERAVRRLQEIEEPEFHELKCYIRLYKNAGKELQAELYIPLAKLIKQAAEVDPKEWEGYVATPLTFVDAPDAPFADLFDRQLLLGNVAFLQKQMIDGTHWEPSWEWGQYEDEWAKARLEWSGKLTVENLRILHAFGTD